jgi:hypothetical protein
MRNRTPRAIAETGQRFFMWLLFGLITATAISGAIATGIAVTTIF